MFVELIKLGNKAKVVQEYDLANAIFAVILDKYFGLSKKEREATDVPPVAWLTWETQDELGVYPAEVYYDLLVVEAAEYFEESGGYKLHSLNIPLPLINFFAALTAMKAASITERAEHGREHRAPKENEVEDLWKSFFGIVDKSIIKDAMSNVLDSNECELVFERVSEPEPERLSAETLRSLDKFHEC
jgi:hypothetical protein